MHQVRDDSDGSSGEPAHIRHHVQDDNAKGTLQNIRVKSFDKTRGAPFASASPAPAMSTLQVAEKVYTITFCDVAENHVRMQKIGTLANAGYSTARLQALAERLTRDFEPQCEYMDSTLRPGPAKVLSRTPPWRRSVYSRRF